MTTTPTTTTEPVVRLAAMELRLPIDAGDPPLGYPNGDDTIDVEIALDNGTGFVNLVLPIDTARMWAADLFGAVTVAHREATGDPHALTDHELAELPDPNGYHPAVTLSLAGTPDEPARMRFTIALEICGQHLCDGRLRQAIVEQLLARFTTATVAVSNGHAVAGTPD